MIRLAKGDIFETDADIRVNTVNCVGVMGAGVALAFKTRYPKMFKEYRKDCKTGIVKPGDLHIWKDLIGNWVINFPTKRHWRQSSRLEDVEAGLIALRKYISEQGKVKVALPALGCGHGGLDWNVVLKKIKSHLSDLEAEIIVFEPSASHAAGRKAVEGDEETLEELRTSGVSVIEPGHEKYPLQLRGRGAATFYIRGASDIFQKNLFAVLPSSKPEQREIDAATACMELIARQGVTLFVGYNPAIERPMIRMALNKGADIAIMLVDGILNFKIRKDLQDVWDEDRITVISAVPPKQRWSPVLASKARASNFILSKVSLITDPSPDWLAKTIERKQPSHLPQVFHINYQTKDIRIKGSLNKAGSYAIGRNPESGNPNVQPIIDCLMTIPDMKIHDKMPYDIESNNTISPATAVSETASDQSHFEGSNESRRPSENLLRYSKRLIEVDLPIKRISAHARREKDMRKGHIPNLLIYPAARPTGACRAVACAALWPDPGDKICPPRFVETAKRLMEYWSLECLRKCSSDSYPQFNKIAKKPDCLDDTTELRKALLDVIADFANWDNSTDPDYLAVMQTLTVAAHDAQGEFDAFSLPKRISVKTLNEAIKDARRPLMVDPFAGGGAIPLEGLRCGADTFASDLNPVALLLNKVATEYIHKYGDQLISEIEKWAVWARNRATSFLGGCYPSDQDGAVPIAYLWARTILCEGPRCGAKIPLLRSLMLARKGKKQVGLQFSVQVNSSSWSLRIVKKESGAWRYQDTGESVSPPPMFSGTVKNGSATCPCCGHTTPIGSVVNQLSDRRGGSKDSLLFVVVTANPGTRGRSFRLPNAEDTACIVKSEELLHQMVSEQSTRDKCIYGVPHEILPPAGALGFRVQRYGMTEWQDLFNNRQLLSLLFYSQLVREYITEVVEKDIQDAVNACLSLIICRLADLNTALCVWQLNTPNTAHLFGRWALSMAWDYGEINPLAQAGGSPESALRRMLRTISYISEGISREGNTAFASAYSHPLPDNSANVFFTDPPYYDAIPYSDLMDFFYVWMKRTLCGNLTQLIESDLCPKEDECILDEMKGKDRDYYEHGMFRAMIEGRRVLSPGGVGVVVFAHKSTSGWEAQLDSMVRAGWRITASWPIDTEMGSRLRAKDSAALASSVHLVCRPRENGDGNVIEHIGDWRDVLSELPKRINEWMPRLAKEGVVGADAIFSCLGPALEIYSRYSSVEKASGEKVELKEYLEEVWAAVSREALNMIFEGANASGFEEDARLTAMWLWTLRTAVNGGNGGDENGALTKTLSGYTLEYDAARKIAQGLGAHLEKLSHLVEVKGNTAMLLSAGARTRYLFGKDPGEAPKGRKKKSAQQKFEFMLEVKNLESESGDWAGDLSGRPGSTVLDQLHQSMILFGAGRGEAMKRFLVEEGVGRNPLFWRLAQALSALYPAGTDEKRWVDGVLARKKGLGF